jgi:arginyl-tRNA synthetase
MDTVRTLLESRLGRALEAVGGEPAAATIAQASDPRFGDYQTNVALHLAKIKKTNPRQVATEIIAALDVSDIAAPPEIAGAGFINFRLTTEFLSSRFRALFSDARLGVPAAGRPRRILIDFSSPNVAKPMHVGHIRGTILGDALTRIARFLGHEVITDNHLGDWGTQFGMVIYGWKHFRDLEAVERDAVAELVRLYRAVNERASADEAIRTACKDELVKLQAGDPENLAIWKECVALSWRDFERIYSRLEIGFDEHLGESAYNDRLAPLVNRLIASGIAEESDGAICIFFRDDPSLAEKPCLIRKRDGASLYATTDLATIEYRIERWHPDAIWYVVGAPQELHFRQLFSAAAKMGIATELRHIPFGSILGEDRKLMKTRSGENVALGDLLSEARERALRIIREKNPALSPGESEQIAAEIGFGAIKYAELSQYRMTDYVFSWDKLLSFQGNTAPYLQNAHVRIRSIFRKLESGWTPAVPESVALSEEGELALARKLLQFGEVVPVVLDECRPNFLASYLYELATTFHGFYEACPVLKAPDGIRDLRLALCDATARVLAAGLGLLGIRAPERM